MRKHTRWLTAGVLGVFLTVLAGASSPLAAEFRISRVAAFTVDTWTRNLSAGWHQVVVNGDGDTDLDLFIYDADGRLLAADDDSTDYCVARWFQPRRGTVYVVIKNLGNVYNAYEMQIE